MQTHKPVHANHCFECFDGGQLIICDACPASYHEGCLKNLPNSDGAWFCPDCAKGKQIFYKDIVWAKVRISTVFVFSFLTWIVKFGN